MKFDVVFSHNETREFERIPCNGQDCILGTPKDSALKENEENISVLNQNVTYHSGQLGEVLYPVNMGDYIAVRKKANGTLDLRCYKVISITDTKVICGPAE